MSDPTEPRPDAEGEPLPPPTDGLFVDDDSVAPESEAPGPEEHRFEAVTVEQITLVSIHELPTQDAREPKTDEPNTLAFILEALAGLEHSVQKRFDALHSTFEREVRAESTREKVVDRLHAELQEYKNDLLLNTLRPMFVDLIQLHDDIGKIVAANDPGEEPADPGKLIDLMRGFQQGIEDILYRQGVEPYQNLTDDAFDPRRQRAYATVPNDDPGRAKRIAARLRKGFQAGEKVIRPEIVSVYASPK